MNGDYLPNATLEAPVKTLWFEFLLQPALLEQHLRCENPDPSAIDLIIQFLSNAYNSPSPVNNTCSDESESLQLSQLLTFSQNGVSQKKDESLIETKKSIAIKLLAIKAAAFLEWDVSVFENRLPLTMQDCLLNEAIKFCEKHNAPDSCKLFLRVIYFRWILRCVLRFSYPSRGPKGSAVPFLLQQHMDPLYVSHEAIDQLMKKLLEQISTSVNDLEKVASDYRKDRNLKISRPDISSFGLCSENVEGYNWENSVTLESGAFMDELFYDLGRWFFCKIEDYRKANEYFEQVTLTRREDFKFLDGYLTATRSLINEEIIYDDQSEFDVVEVVHLTLKKITQGETDDISIFDKIENYKELGSLIIEFYNQQSEDVCKRRLKRFTIYLANRITSLKEFLMDSEFGIQEKQKTYVHTDVEMFEEGEIEEVFVEDEAREQALALLESTDPEMIQNIATRLPKSSMLASYYWELPPMQKTLIQNLPLSQQDKCYFVLVKAAQLRAAKLFFESRTLYVSLLEDFQASLPLLAEVIKWELLRTDLENHFNQTDVDERRINDFVEKSVSTLKSSEQALLEFPELTELCCLFLTSYSNALKEFSNSNVGIVRMFSLLNILSSDGCSPSSSLRAKEFFELILNSFMNQKKIQHPINILQLNPTNVINCMTKLKNSFMMSIVLFCVAKIHNLIRDNSCLEISIPAPFAPLWPSVVGSSIANLNSGLVSNCLNILLADFLKQKPNELKWLKCKAELAAVEGDHYEALKYFINHLMISTKYFTLFSKNYCDEEPIIQRMIQSSVKLNCHTQAAALCQVTREPNYALAFKALSERTCFDSCDDVYDYIWDITMLEYLVSLHSRRGEIERKTKTIQLIGHLELNSNNNEEILLEASNVRRGQLFRMLLRKYL